MEPELGPGPRGRLALLTDLYQFTMAYGYWRAGRHREPAEFELSFRRCPLRGGFVLGAGLGECLAFLRAFRLAPADIEYLRSALPSTTHEAFFDYLSTVDTSEVTVAAVPEGSAVFPRVPLLQVKGPLLVVQLLETTLLCLVNYASLVATNAARFRLLAGPDKKLMEMGLRRAQGPDGALSASKYSYVGGFDFTSNVLAGQLYGIPVRGTVAHSYIMSFSVLAEAQPRMLAPWAGGEPVDFPCLAVTWLERVCQLLHVPREGVSEGELAAFVSYAVAFPCSFQGLVDTYSVMRSGVPNFCGVALALAQLGYRAIGVRLDSGDLARQAAEIRRVLRACSIQFQLPWFEAVPIAVSNDISEQSLEAFGREGSDIDMIGIGTHLVTCPRQPSLGCIYKLVQVNGRPRMKLTEEEEKMTLPGCKAVYRLWDAAGRPFMDLLALADESPPRAGQELEVWVLGGSPEALRVIPAAAETLHRTYLKDGQDALEAGDLTPTPCYALKGEEGHFWPPPQNRVPQPEIDAGAGIYSGAVSVCEPLPSLPEIRSHAKASLCSLGPAHKKLREPEAYQVAMTEKLHALLQDLRQASQ